MTDLSTGHEPTEEEWAVIGRYLARRMRATSPKMDGTKTYCFRGGWPELRGRSVPHAVMRAIVMEDESRKEMEGGEA